MIRLTLAAALLALPALAAAQTSAGGAASPPQRIRSVQLTAGQQCPKGAGDEIVVCSPAEEPYRIPKSLRDSGPIPAQNQSWVNRVADIDQTGRVAGGLPNTCSPIGNGGQTGCSVQAAKQWAAEKRAQRRAESSIP
jgi:hypothetical protein